MTDVVSIRCALEAMGVPAAAIVEAPEGLPLRGYRGRGVWGGEQMVHVYVVGEALGGDRSDVGLERTSTGYKLHMSPSRLRDSWRFASELPRRYAEQHQRRLDAMQAQARRAEEERRAEEQRRLVAAQRESVVQRAKAMGYAVHESVVDGRVRLVLSKASYA
jgi:hypothetical protein